MVNGEANPHMGDQIRGFGFNHDGSNPTVFDFHLRKETEQFIVTVISFTNRVGDIQQQLAPTGVQFFSLIEVMHFLAQGQTKFVHAIQAVEQEICSRFLHTDAQKVRS